MMIGKDGENKQRFQLALLIINPGLRLSAGAKQLAFYVLLKRSFILLNLGMHAAPLGHWNKIVIKKIVIRPHQAQSLH
ncbi:MAG: hypothetical protein WB392_11715 [Methanotrichaceae archaeon]